MAPAPPFMSPEIMRSCAPYENSLWRGVVSWLRVSLFYGGCGPNTGYPVILPLLALLGGRDDWTPAAPCVALANAQPNGIMQAVVYPDAYHSFDAAGGIEKPHSAYGHMLAYNPAATADAHKQAVEFLSRYLR